MLKKLNLRILKVAAAIIAMSGWMLLNGNAAVKAQNTYSVQSPDHRIRANVTVNGGLSYCVWFQGKPVILESPFALEFQDAPPISAGLAVIGTKPQSIHNSWENPLGKRSHVVDNANELRISLKETGSAGRKFDFLVRAYNDGVAFRYYLPKQDKLTNFILTKESFQFRFAANPTVWAANYGGYSSSQESEFHKQPMRSLSSENPYGTPLLVQANATSWVALTEADLQDWGGMYLSGISQNSGEKLVETPVIRGSQQGQKISVSISGKQALRLVVGDGGDDFTFDHADWADAKLTGKDGKIVYVSDLKPLSVVQGYGSLQADKSVGGSALKIGDKSYAKGLGSHSKGEIIYRLDGKYDRFESIVGIDSETAGKGSVTFAVYAESANTTGPTGLTTRIAPRKDGKGLVQSSAPRYSPWRVLLIGQRPGDLVESDLVLNLSEPNALGDTSWVKPGKCAWDHWWSGDVKMDTPTQQEYIQFAADMGFPYQLVDWQWYGQFNTPQSDITHINPNLDMPELLRYAKERNVRLFVWLHSSDVDRALKSGKLDDAFVLFQKWGLAGVKIDFMDRDDQEMVNWYYSVIKKAAEHRLMVDFHGAYKPTGTQRTYPNQITREGVLGEEYDKFSTRVTPEHDCTLPFTRMLAGPMDYTPGGFLNRSSDKWKQTLPTQVQGTRCHELAKFVIFDSPLMVLCDDPKNYRNQPGLEFLRVVPTVWDETKIADGFPGEFVISTRRSSKDWFIGGMTNWDSRTVEIPLRFLGKDKFIAHIYSDAPDADAEAEHLIERTQEVTSNKVLTIRMASGGGVAIHLTPMK